MRPLYLSAPLLIALLASCSTAEWVHPNKPKDEFAHDYNRCDRETMLDPKMQGGAKLVVEQGIERCMAKRGWVLREKRD